MLYFNYILGVNALGASKNGAIMIVLTRTNGHSLHKKILENTPYTNYKYYYYSQIKKKCSKESI